MSVAMVISLTETYHNGRAEKLLIKYYVIIRDGGYRLLNYVYTGGGGGDNRQNSVLHSAVQFECREKDRYSLSSYRGNRTLHVTHYLPSPPLPPRNPSRSFASRYHPFLAFLLASPSLP